MLYDSRAASQDRPPHEMQQLVDNTQAVGGGCPRGPAGVAIPSRPDILRGGLELADRSSPQRDIEILRHVAQGRRVDREACAWARIYMNVLPGDFAGAHASARIPVSRALLNRAVADALAGTTSPVRSVDIRPRAGDQFDAVVTVTWPFVPALTVAFTIEQQPAFPDSPILVLHWSFLGAVGALASRLLGCLTASASTANACS